MAAILSLAMLLEHSFSLSEEADCINKAVEACIAEGILTEDLTDGPAKGTDEVGDAVAGIIAEVSQLSAKSE
jgi:3-isopropylmalate dehydrogenase